MIRICRIFLFLVQSSLLWGADGTPEYFQTAEVVELAGAFEMGAGIDGACSTRSRSEHDTRCHAAIRRFSVKKCLEDGHPGSIEEIDETYSFYYGSAGRCSTRPGDYIVVECSAYFRCVE